MHPRLVLVKKHFCWCLMMRIFFKSSLNHNVFEDNDMDHTAYYIPTNCRHFIFAHRLTLIVPFDGCLISWALWWMYVSSTLIKHLKNFSKNISLIIFNGFRCNDLSWAYTTFGVARVSQTRRNSINHFQPIKLLVQSPHRSLHFIY